MKVTKRHYTIALQLQDHLKPFKLHMLVKHHQEVEFNLLPICNLPIELSHSQVGENAEIQFIIQSMTTIAIVNIMKELLIKFPEKSYMAATGGISQQLPSFRFYENN